MWLQVKWTKPVSLEGSGSDKGGGLEAAGRQWSRRLRGNGLQSVVTWQGFQKAPAWPCRHHDRLPVVRVKAVGWHH